MSTHLQLECLAFCCDIDMEKTRSLTAVSFVSAHIQYRLNATKYLNDAVQREDETVRLTLKAEQHESKRR